MARKKHLINVHTSTGTTAPTGASLYLGEIAVQHKPNDPALWIKVGTAETSTTYEKFIGSTEITNMVSAASGLVKDLSAVTLTGVTMNSSPVSVTNHVANLGTVITAETQLSTATTGTGNVVGSIGVSNHKITSTLFSAASADQISKLSGATTAHTANTTMHITATERTRGNNAWTSGVSAYTKVEALSAGTINLVGASAATVFSSAKTYTDNEIGKLDSTGHSSDSNHYLTSVTITDGKITDIGEAQVPAESDITTATSGNGNVITNLTATGHQITMVKGITAATSAQVTTLSSATVAHINSAASHVSATDRTTWNGKQDAITDLATIRNNALSGASAYTNVNSLSAATTAHTANTTVHVTENDKSKWNAAITGVTSAGTGNAFTSYSVANNVLTLTKGATYLTTAATTTQGDRADSALQTICGSTYITTNAKSGGAGAKIQTVTAKQQNVETASATGQGLADAYDVKQYVDGIVTSTVNYKGATATLPTTSKVGDMYITTGQIVLTAAQSATGAAQTAETGDFIIARENGKWDVIQKNLDGAVTGNLTADTVTLGNGTHTVKSLANGSNGTVLAVVSNKPAWTNAVKVNSATTADSATNATNATNAVSATTSLSANTAAALTGNITTGQVTNLTTKIQTTKVNSATTADSATNATNAVSATTSLSANVATNATKVNNHTVNSDVPSNAVFTDTKVTAVGNHYTATTATKTGGTTTTTADWAVKGITYDAAGHIVSVVSGSVLTSASDTATTEDGHYSPTTSASTKGTTAATTSFVKGIRIDSKNHVIDVVTGTVVTAQTQLSTATTGTGNVVCGLTVSNHQITTLMFSAAPADALVALSAATTAHTANTTAHITSTERTRWNNAWTSGVSAYTKVEALSAATTGISKGLTDLSAVTITGVTQNGTSVVSNHVASIVETAISTGNGSSVSSAAAAVVTGITTGGTKGHTLTLNKTNKVFSASTTDSAKTSFSAITSLSAVTSLSAITATLGPAYTYSGIPYVTSATSISDAYSALTNELIKDEKTVSAAFNDLNDRVRSLEQNSGSSADLEALSAAVVYNYNYIDEVEYVAAQALNDLNNRIDEVSENLSGVLTLSVNGVPQGQYSPSADTSIDLTVVTEVTGADVLLTGYQLASGSTEQELIVVSSDTVNEAIGKLQKQNYMSNDDVEILSGSVVSKEYVIANSLNDLNDRIIEISATTQNCQEKTRVENSQPANGMLPNVFYNLGQLTGNVTLEFDDDNIDNSILNHYYFTFSVGSTIPTITYPYQINSWFGGSEPVLVANSYYEVSVINGVAAYIQV